MHQQIDVTMVLATAGHQPPILSSLLFLLAGAELATLL